MPFLPFAFSRDDDFSQLPTLIGLDQADPDPHGFANPDFSFIEPPSTLLNFHQHGSSTLTLAAIAGPQSQTFCDHRLTLIRPSDPSTDPAPIPARFRGGGMKIKI